MTGSPVTKNPLDLFTQCYFLDPFHLEHESYFSFRMRYAIMKTAHISGRSIQLVSGFKNLGELYDKLKIYYVDDIGPISKIYYTLERITNGNQKSGQD